MTKHLLVDLENVQPRASAVAAWIGSVGKAWIFYGPHQHKLLKSFQALGERVTLVPISRPGANSLDFHLVFYLGYLAAGNPKSEFTLLAKDTGYDPAIDHARMLTFTVKRISALRSPSAKTASTVIADVVGAPHSVKSAKKPANAKKGAARKIPVAGKSPTKKTVISNSMSTAREVPDKEPSAVDVTPPTKKSAAATTDDKTLLSAAQTARPPTVSPARKPTLRPVIAIYRDVLADLHGSNRPRSLASLERRIQSRIGSEPAPEKVQTIIDRLKTTDAIRVIGDQLVYFPDE